MTMFSKKSALFLSIALLFSASSVIAADAEVKPKATSTWTETATNTALWLPRTVGNELYPKDGSYLTVRDAKNEISWLNTARMNVARLALAGVATAAVYCGFIKTNKKAKTAKPKTNVRSEVTAS